MDTDLKDVVVRDYSAITEPCGVTFVYTDDYVWEFKNVEIQELFSKLDCKRKLMFINYRLGDIGKLEWTKGFDHYGALNSGIIDGLLKNYPEAEGKTSVMPPCTDLSAFLEIKPDYENVLKIVRHSSQGNTKYDPETFNQDLERIHEARPEAIIRLMPPPSFCLEADYIIKHNRNNPPVPEFLELGNLYWYSLPGTKEKPYLDMGPRVICESHAAGLAAIAVP